MKLTVVGCSDAFGSGGRLQTCFHVATPSSRFLIDCGATTLIGLEREGLDPNTISVVLVTHLHGDHFSGLVWWLIHARHVSKRTEPLTIVGPEGIQERLRIASEALFPGTADLEHGFALSFVTYNEPQVVAIGDMSVQPFVVSHPSGATSYALRISCHDRVIAFSGDTEWVDALVPCSQNADLFIAECFAYETEAKYHMSWRTISENLHRLTAKRIMLTHMGPEMLAHRSAVQDSRVLLAEDGLVLDL